MLRVTLSLGGNVVRKYPFDRDRVVIGRDPECDIAIDNVAVSRNHASLRRDGASWLLEDLQSGNGTYVGGERISKRPMASGESFVIGKYTLLFETLSDAEAAVDAASRKAGGEDRTFRMESGDIERVVGKAGRGGDLRASLVPQGGGSAIPLIKPFYFAGSAPDCAIPASGFLVSPRVALLVRDEGGYRLVKVGGRFGKVTVNGQASDSRVLKSGDVVDLCGRTFKYES